MTQHPRGLLAVDHNVFSSNPSHFSMTKAVAFLDFYNDGVDSFLYCAFYEEVREAQTNLWTGTGS
jgi:hypothetical protein